MDDVKDLIRRIRKIEIATKALAEGVPTGIPPSLFRGQGIEFASLREYVPGDDTRAIDWKVSARLNHPFVREFTEDRQGTFYLVVDRSASVMFGSNCSKDEKMLEVAASLLFAAERNHERTGLCIVTDRVECFIRARQGRSHLVHLLTALVRHRPLGKMTDLGGMIRFLSDTLTRRSTIIILSDFYAPSFELPLRILARRHEVIAVRITDIREMELPDTGLVALEDMESGEQVLLDTSDATFRSRFYELAREEDERMLSRLRKFTAGTISLKSSDPSLLPLRRFFSLRRQGA
jgi:uncharacterized protein (DUF58 family)